MLNGLSLDKLLIVGIIAVFLLGPSRLPVYAKKLAVMVKRLRAYATDAQERIREEMGPGFDDVDWKKLDPRQYDPRRIIREALFEEDDDGPQVHTGISASADADSEDDATPGGQAGPEPGQASPEAAQQEAAGAQPPPFDAEAT